jgi:hypothetical protein
MQCHFLLAESPIHIKSEGSGAEGSSLSPTAGSPVLIRTPQMSASSPEASTNKTTGKVINVAQGSQLVLYISK